METVTSSKSGNSSVVINSASQGVISSGVETAEVPLQIVIAVVHASLVACVNRWASGEDLLAVVDARVSSAGQSSVWRSVRAVIRAETVRSLSVVHSASKGVSADIISNASNWVKNCADVVASNISLVPQNLRTLKRPSVRWVAVESSDRAISIAVVTALKSSRRRCVWAVNGSIRWWISSKYCVVSSAANGVSGGVIVSSDWESSTNGHAVCHVVVPVYALRVAGIAICQKGSAIVGACWSANGNSDTYSEKSQRELVHLC